MQADNYFQLPNFGNEKGAGIYQPSGNAYNKWMKRNSGDAIKGAQNFHLTGQTPQGLMGLEANHGHQYAAGSFPVGKHGGGYNSNRLQNAINSNRNRYFQHQFVNDMPESMSNRMLQGIQGGQFNNMDPQQQSSANRFYMNGNRRVPQSFKPPFNYAAHGVPFDSMLPNIPGQYHEFDLPDDLDEEEGNYRYKYNNKYKQDSDEYNTVDLIGKYAKYYRAQDYQNEQNKQIKAAPTSNDKNNELVSRYLKHAAKKQVRSTSINVPKYTGDYDPDVFVTGKLQSDENISQSSLTQNKQPSQEEINRESLFNKQEAAAEQKFRLEKANFPAPSSLNNASAENNSEKAKYKLKYTKRKKMVIASTSDKENDPSMLVKGGGDDVTVGNDDEVTTPIEEETKATEFIKEKEKPIIHEEIIEQAAVKVPTAKKIIKKMRRQSVTPKLVPEKEAEKKVEVSNKQQSELTNKPKVTKTVDIRKQVKKVTIEKVKRSVPVVATKNEEQPAENKEEETEENDKLQSTVEEEQLPHLQNDSYHGNGSSEEELQFANDEDNAEKLAQQKADEELNAILAPLRAQVPDHIRISPTLGFLPIMPVTFSWFPMSQQHKEAFQKMSEQSKFPNSLRPFQRFAAT